MHKIMVHDPIPWKLTKAIIGVDEDYLIHTEDDVHIAEVFEHQDLERPHGPSKENAEFIIRAVNNHDALLEALEAFVLTCENHPELKEYDARWPEGSLYGKAEAAIAKAKIEITPPHMPLEWRHG